mmetsp:Transcript_38834/g.86779  ORF Transcript_38834/g.86779 Transcript_38834/m.86779 type:complete len:279 (-) Transcript_38834:53-889(-)
MGSRAAFEACARPPDGGAGLALLFALEGAPPFHGDGAKETAHAAARAAEASGGAVADATTLALWTASGHASGHATSSHESAPRAWGAHLEREGDPDVSTDVSGGNLRLSAAEFVAERVVESARLAALEARARATGLPSPKWRWIGPWVVDSVNYGADRRASAEVGPGAAEASGGWLYGGIGWPRDDSSYFREPGRSRLVRCRRWIRPRERIETPEPVAASVDANPESHSPPLASASPAEAFSNASFNEANLKRAGSKSMASNEADGSPTSEPFQATVF